MAADDRNHDAWKDPSPAKDQRVLNTHTRTTRSNFGHLQKQETLNLFTMDGNLNVEHHRSTGIRDGTAPNPAVYDRFEELPYQP